MKNIFYGTKKIKARIMTRQEYVDYRGWILLDDENGSDAGYLVEYMDGGKSNHHDHDGYISWSPADVFEAAYQPNNELSFSHALNAMKDGHKVARRGWNGKGMFVFLTEGRNVPNNKERSFAHFDGETVKLASHIDMKAADGSYVSGWLASQSDMLSDDWYIIFD